MSETKEFTIGLEQIGNFEFRVKFDGDGAADFVMDEPEPLGRGAGPNASRVLGAAIGNCLTASLLFCARKSRVEMDGLRTEVAGRLEKNDQGRWRIRDIGVRIHVPTATDASTPQIDRCLRLFEDYCVVTASVRQGIPVNVEVIGQDGERLFSGGND